MARNVDTTPAGTFARTVKKLATLTPVVKSRQTLRESLTPDELDSIENGIKVLSTILDGWERAASNGG